MKYYRDIPIDRNAVLNGAISAAIMFFISFFFLDITKGSFSASIVSALITWFLSYIVCSISNRYKSTPSEGDSRETKK
jgi:hypothetical protein